MNFSDIIYKFRAWENPLHRNILQLNELYYASPADINDPFDFQVSYDLTLLDTDEKQEMYIDQMLNDAKNILKERDIDPIKRKQELLLRLKNIPTTMQDEYDSTNTLWTNNRFGVISFAQRWDSILMWSHYANNHRGFCVGFNRHKFEESKLFDTAGSVNYTDSYPKIDPLKQSSLDDVFSKTHTKSSEWNYEKEYRLTRLWVDSDPSKDDRKIYFHNGLFEEILLGLLISSNDKLEIIEIARQKNIPVYQVRKKRSSFLLERVKI